MIRFSLENDSLHLTMLNEHIECIIPHLIKAYPNETGGIIVGSYSEDFKTAKITLLTGPPKGSKNGPTWFIRSNRGIKKLLQKKWDVEKEFYLGEWHLHPNGTTSPSPQDLAQLAEISKSSRYNCAEPIMIIIAGTPQKFKIQPYIMLPENKCYALRPNQTIE
jgi:hypothetical protein